MRNIKNKKSDIKEISLLFTGNEKSALVENSFKYLYCVFFS